MYFHVNIFLYPIISLPFLPVNLFGFVMNFEGFAITTRLFKMLNLNNILPNVIDGIVIIIFVILIISYLLKIIFFPAKIKTEFNNQITVNF